MTKNLENKILIILDKDTSAFEKMELLGSFEPKEQIQTIERSGKDDALIRYIPDAKPEVQMAALKHNERDFRYIEPANDAVLIEIHEIEKKHEALEQAIDNAEIMRQNDEEVKQDVIDNMNDELEVVSDETNEDIITFDDSEEILVDLDNDAVDTTDVSVDADGDGVADSEEDSFEVLKTGPFMGPIDAIDDVDAIDEKALAALKNILNETENEQKDTIEAENPSEVSENKPLEALNNSPVEIEDKPLPKSEIDKINNKTDKNLMALYSKDLGIIFMPANVVAENDGLHFSVDWDDKSGNDNEFKLSTNNWQAVDLSESKFTAALLNGNTNEALTEFVKEFYIPELVVDDKFKVDDLFKDKNNPRLSKIKTEMALFEKDFKNGFKIKDASGNRTLDPETSTWSRIAVSEFLNHLDNTTIAAEALAYEIERQYADLDVPQDVQDQIEALKAECKEKMITALESNESTADNTKIKAEMEAYRNKTIDSLSGAGWNFRNFNLPGFLIESLVKLVGRHWITKGATTEFEKKARLKAFGSNKFNEVAGYARQYSKAYENLMAESTAARDILISADTKVDVGDTPGQIADKYREAIDSLIEKSTQSEVEYNEAGVEVKPSEKDETLARALEEFDKEWELEKIPETGNEKVDDVLKELNDLKKIDNDKELKSKMDRVNEINNKLKSEKLTSNEKNELKNELEGLKKDFEKAKEDWKSKETEVYGKFKALSKEERNMVRDTDPSGKKLMRADNDKIDAAIASIDSLLDNIDTIDTVDVKDDVEPQNVEGAVDYGEDQTAEDNLDLYDEMVKEQGEAKSDDNSSDKTPEKPADKPNDNKDDKVDVKESPEYKELLAKYEASQKENAELKEKIAELEGKLDKVASDVEVLSQKVDGLEKDNKELRSELSDKNTKNEFELKLENLKLELKEKYGDKFDSSIIDKISLNKGTKSEINNISKSIEFVVNVQDNIAADPNKSVEILSIKGDQIEVQVDNGEGALNYTFESSNSDGRFDTVEISSAETNDTIMRVETDGANLLDRRFIGNNENVDEILAKRIENNGKDTETEIGKPTDFTIAKVEIPNKSLTDKKDEDLSIKDIVAALEGVTPEEAEAIIEEANEVNNDEAEQIAENEKSDDNNDSNDDDDYDYSDFAE